MPFIQPEPFTFLNIKLTDYGRALASVGRLKFDYVVLSDREIDYRVDEQGNFDIQNNKVLDIPHYYPDTDFFNYDDSSPLNPGQFKISSEKIQVTSTTQSSVISSKALGTGQVAYSSNSSNWGTNKITFASLSYAPSVNQLVFIPWVDPAYSGTYSISSLPQSVPSVVLTYKIISALTSTDFLLDRPIPDYGGSSATVVCDFFYDNLIDGHIGNNPSTDPGVWNLNIVRTQNVPGNVSNMALGISGFTTYGSLEYNGARHFFGFGQSPATDAGFGNGDIPMLGFLHYSNKYSGCTYAEQFVEGSFKLNLPTVMWHHGYQARYYNSGSTFDSFNSSGTTWGLYASDSLGTTFYDQYARSTFRYLYDGLNTGVTIGRVYHKLKMVLLTDQELLTALSYKSNRNYTLPPFSLTTSPTPQIGLYGANAFSGNSTVSGLTATGLVKDGYVYFVTYIAENEPYSLGTSLGNPPAQHCGYVQKLIGNSAPDGSAQFLKIDFPYPNSFPFMRDDAALSSGLYDSGWNANTVQILLNIQQNEITGNLNINTVPSNQWMRVSDKTLGGNGVYRASDWGDNTIDPKKLNAYSFIISEQDYQSGSTYTLDTSITANQRSLNFGDECFLYGNIETGILSSVYKMRLSVYLPENELNGTMNSTFVEGTDADVYITEIVLVYANRVVAAGKPTYPIRKSNTRILTFQLDYDF